MGNAVMCQIEHHAALYGLIAQAAIQSGLAAQCALSKATAQYGEERGKRMGEYADQENLPHIMQYYSLFKEWRPDRTGQMVHGESLKTPEHVTTVYRCEWVETWKKYGLLEYGRTYCIYVDKGIARGFSKDLDLDIPSLQSFGAPCCIFNWGYPRTDAVERELETRQREIGEKYVKDFNFHTAHLYCSILKVLKRELGEEGRAICEQALKKFVSLFGEDYTAVLRDTAEKAGWTFN